VSSRTHRPVIVKLVEVGISRRNMIHVCCFFSGYDQQKR